jgi:RNA polymerase sigma factor for flagellar operon FliA
MSASSPVTDLNRLWTDYKATPDDRQLRDHLIVHYSPLVKYVAGRVATGLPHSVDQADLVSYGIIGLIDAIEKFDLERGFKFETYAIARIRGSMIDELRSIDWVPRSVRAKARQIEQAFATLEGRLKRVPTDAELAEELDCSESELQTMLGQISFTGLVALDELLGGAERDGTTTLGDSITDGSPGPLAAYEVTEVRERLADAIRGLPEREKVVVGLYYYENLTLAEIGTILGVTESRVCQLHTKAVLHLRVRVGSLAGDLAD